MVIVQTIEVMVYNLRKIFAVDHGLKRTGRHWPSRFFFCKPRLLIFKNLETIEALLHNPMKIFLSIQSLKKRDARGVPFYYATSELENDKIVNHNYNSV